MFCMLAIAEHFNAAQSNLQKNVALSVNKTQGEPNQAREWSEHAARFVVLTPEVGRGRLHLRGPPAPN